MLSFKAYYFFYKAKIKKPICLSIRKKKIVLTFFIEKGEKFYFTIELGEKSTKI